MSASETLARCQRLREALLGAMVQRESAVKHVLRRLPPTAGIMSLHRSDGTVLFEVPPSTVASWETAVDALGPPQLILLDAGFRLLSETEDELDDITAGLEGLVAVRNQLLQSLDRRVNRFVARQERKASGTDADDDPTARSLDTIVLVRHRRMVAHARANGTNPVSLEQVYRSMLMAQDESRFCELPDLDLQLQAEADDVERALRTFTWVLQGRLSPSDEEGWGSQHVDNVARNPWEMRLDRVARSVRVLRLASADMHNGVSATANHLRTLGQAASNAECAATLTRLGQNWHRLTADFETALEEDDDNDNNGAGGEDVMRLARERVRLEQVVEPLLHRFEDCIQFEMAEDPTASSGYDDEHEYEEAAWQQFYRMGRRSRAELAALQEAHAKALFELSVGKDDANRYVVEHQSPLLMIETMTDVHRHIAFAHRIRAQLPADQRPPNLPDPEAVLDAFALAYVPAEWDRSPRPEQVVDDAITFVFEWLALSHLTEDYRVAFAQRARERFPSDPSNRDPNLRLDRKVRYVSAPLRSLRPLPTLRDAAVALAARLHQRHAQKGMQLTAVR